MFFFENLEASAVFMFLINLPDGKRIPLLIFLAYVLVQQAITLLVKIILQRRAPVLVIRSGLSLKKLLGI